MKLINRIQMVYLVGLVYVTPGGQAVLGLVDYFGGGFIIFVLGKFNISALTLSVN